MKRQNDGAENATLRSICRMLEAQRTLCTRCRNKANAMAQTGGPEEEDYRAMLAALDEVGVDIKRHLAKAREMLEEKKGGGGDAGDPV